MSGKILAIFFAVLILVSGFGMYYLQTYYFYREIPAAEYPSTVTLPSVSGAEIVLPVSDYRAIHSVSTPIGNRACFKTDVAALAEAETYAKPTPISAPRWFDCFAYDSLTEDLESGAAKAYLVQKNVAPKIDSVLAVYPDGRAFEWRQQNEEAEEKRTID